VSTVFFINVSQGKPAVGHGPTMLDHPSTNICGANRATSDHAAIPICAGLLAVDCIGANQLDEGLGCFETALILSIIGDAGLLGFWRINAVQPDACPSDGNSVTIDHSRDTREPRFAWGNIAAIS
jgi:hypothetical protein